MSYTFVAAPKFTAGGMREVRAAAVHMAEGGGTVSWLSHPYPYPQGNNSSHYVIEYTGRIVQMVREADASWSLHVARSLGPPGPGDFGTYSLDAAKAVLGDGIYDPNRFIIAIELEGYAAVGPNPAQVGALQVLLADLWQRHAATMRGNLAHRDFQDYKPCPGGQIPWAKLGGHGLADSPPPPSGGLEMWPVVRERELVAPNPRIFTLAPGTRLIGYDPARPNVIVLDNTFPAGLTPPYPVVTHLASIAWHNGHPNFPDSAGAFAFALVGAPGAYSGLYVLLDKIILAPPNAAPLP